MTNYKDANKKVYITRWLDGGLFFGKRFHLPTVKEINALTAGEGLHILYNNLIDLPFPYFDRNKVESLINRCFRKKRTVTYAQLCDICKVYKYLSQLLDISVVPGIMFNIVNKFLINTVKSSKHLETIVCSKSLKGLILIMFNSPSLEVLEFQLKIRYISS